jgi:hypothetical protein
MSDSEFVSLEIAAGLQDDVIRVRSSLRADRGFDADVYVLVKPNTSVGLLIAALNAILAGIEKDEIRDKIAQGQATWTVPAKLIELFEPGAEPEASGSDDAG